MPTRWRVASPQAEAEAQLAAARAQPSRPSPLRLQLDPADGAATRFSKRLLYSAKLLFAALLSVVVALAASLAA